MGNELAKEAKKHGKFVPSLDETVDKSYALPTGAVFVAMSNTTGDLPLHEIPGIVLESSIDVKEYQDCIYEINRRSIHRYSRLCSVLKRAEKGSAPWELYYHFLERLISEVELICVDLNKFVLKEYNLIFVPFLHILRDETNNQHFGIIIDKLANNNKNNNVNIQNIENSVQSDNNNNVVVGETKLETQTKTKSKVRARDGPLSLFACFSMNKRMDPDDVDGESNADKSVGTVKTVQNIKNNLVKTSKNKNETTAGIVVGVGQNDTNVSTHSTQKSAEITSKSDINNETSSTSNIIKNANETTKTNSQSSTKSSIQMQQQQVSQAGPSSNESTVIVSNTGSNTMHSEIYMHTPPISSVHSVQSVQSINSMNSMNSLHSQTSEHMESMASVASVTSVTSMQVMDNLSGDETDVATNGTCTNNANNANNANNNDMDRKSNKIIKNNKSRARALSNSEQRDGSKSPRLQLQIYIPKKYRVGPK